MALFFNNLRASEPGDQSNPDAWVLNDAEGNTQSKNQLLNTTLPLFNQKDNVLSPANSYNGFMEDAAERRLWRQEIDKQVKETEPLRKAIREASGGKIIVDKSIYNKTSLERILNTVKNMDEFNGGTLRPGYTVISNGRENNMDNYSENLGEAIYKTYNFNPFFPNFYFQLSPNQNKGSKNAPYQVLLRDANDYEYNDQLAREALDSGWTIQSFNDDDVESATHAHELAHTAYFDALKKTQNPLLSGRYSRETVENFRQTHPSLQEIFDIAARNTGHDTVQDAAATISEYALQDAEEDAANGGLHANAVWSPNYHRLSEVFAEAYADCLYNKDNASEYSKEIIRLYSNYVNDYNKAFNTKIELNPVVTQVDFGKNRFINNLRNSLFQNGK